MKLVCLRPGDAKGPADMKRTRCSGCRAVVLVPVSSKRLVEAGAQPVCPVCGPKTSRRMITKAAELPHDAA
jgi:RNase P subunit RPR2